MDIIDDVTAKADAHGDGKLGSEDLRDLQEKHPEAASRIDPLIDQAEANDDGKINLIDLTSVLGALKQSARDLFGRTGKMLKM